VERTKPKVSTDTSVQLSPCSKKLGLHYTEECKVNYPIRDFTRRILDGNSAHLMLLQPELESPLPLQELTSAYSLHGRPGIEIYKRVKQLKTARWRTTKKKIR